jgi:spore coat polysaccharide biosynthesis protein SpsF
MAGRVLSVLQSRLSSSRLPAKALLPLAGSTVVSLAARRGANSGLPLLVATSADPSDDPLAAHLAQAGLEFVRGSLDDVLGRYEQATRELSDDDVVVRLTADNVLPDGAFVEELVRARAERGDTYLATRSPLDGLPLGLSAEAFTVAALREAARNATLSFDREHVTPWIERTYGTPIFRPAFARSDTSHLRCTLDTFADYLRLCRLFVGITEPVGVSAEALVAHLADLGDEPRFRVPFRVIGGAVHSVLTLDTRGLSTVGLSALDARRMVAMAVAHGVTFLVTDESDLASGARRAGDGLSGGLASQVGTIAVLDVANLDDRSPSTSELHARVDATVLRACRELRVRNLSAIVLNRFCSPAAYEGALFSALRAWQAQGVIDRIGVTVATPEQATAALADNHVGQLDLALGTDERELDAWRASSFPSRLAERPDVIVHLRSARLDALLAAGAERRKDARELIAQLDDLEWISSVVATAGSPEQLTSLLALFDRSGTGERR